MRMKKLAAPVLMLGTVLGTTAAWAQSGSAMANASQGRRCGPRVVRGVYSTAYEGTAFHGMGEDTTSVPTVYLGMMLLNPATGEISGGGTVSVGPETFKVELVDGRFEVLPDCRAFATYFLQPEGAPQPAPVPVLEEWTILEGGQRIRAIITQFPFAAHVTLGDFERITPALRPVRW